VKCNAYQNQKHLADCNGIARVTRASQLSLLYMSDLGRLQLKQNNQCGLGKKTAQSDDKEGNLDKDLAGGMQFGQMRI